MNQGPQHHTVSDSQYVRPTQATQSQSALPPKPNLDSMLGNLQEDMSRQGVNTSQKGCCSACDKPIVGQVITALGKTWHPEHFTCAHCNQELGTRNFFEREAKPYCEPDYHNLFSPRCAYCNGPILDVCQMFFSILKSAFNYYNCEIFRSTGGCLRAFTRRPVDSDNPLLTFRLFFSTEMRHSFGKNLAHGSLLLCSVRKTIWGRRFSRTRRKALLSRRLLRHVRPQMRCLQQSHHGKLYFRSEFTVAPGLLRL